MPNILTHYTFAKDFVMDPSPRYLTATYVGAQGPDPFFYYGVLPLRSRPHKRSVPSLGGITQHLEMPIPYGVMIDYATNSPDKDLLFAYLDGLMMHYALDRAFHPYVFYNTGFTDREGDSEAVHRHYNYGHLCFENILDILIGKKEGTFQRPDKVLRLPKKDALSIGKMWAYVNTKVQHVEGVSDKSFFLSIKDYRSTMRFAHDPCHLKKPLFKKLFGAESLPYGLIYPTSLQEFEGCDFLNEKHATWRMPDGTKRNESVQNLWEEAASIYRSLHACLAKAKNDQPYLTELETLGAHVNHEGIIPGSAKLYWKLIWPASFQQDIISPKTDAD